jgi:RNA polymerase sigma factor (sigma-70 family)
LADWFRDWQQPLRRYLARRRICRPDDVDDIAQEVFLRLLRCESTEFIDHPRAYLFKIAANVSMDWVTRASGRLPHDSAWLTELVDSLSPEVELERQGVDERLRLAVEVLSPRAREILRLQFGEGLSQAQIAGRLGLTPKVVKREMARSYAVLRTTLDSDLNGAPSDTQAHRTA